MRSDDSPLAQRKKQENHIMDIEENIVEFAADIQEIWDDETYTPRVWDPNERWSNMWGPPSLPEFRA